MNWEDKEMLKAEKVRYIKNRYQQLLEKCPNNDINNTFINLVQQKVSHILDN